MNRRSALVRGVGVRQMAGLRGPKMTIVEDRRTPGRRERKKAERRAAIISVARKAFQKSGFDGASMEAIAEDSDISSATLYNYFQSKSELLFSILEQDLSSLSEKITNIAVDSEINPKLLVLNVMNIYFCWFNDYDRGLIRQFVADAIRSPQFHGRSYHHLENLMILHIEGLLNRMVECGNLKSSLDVESSARLIFNIGNSEFYAFIASENFSVDLILDRIGHQVDLAISGIG